MLKKILSVVYILTGIVISISVLLYGPDAYLHKDWGFVVASFVVPVIYVAVGYYSALNIRDNDVR